MKNQRTSGPVIIGGSSLLVIFAVLCLTIFALLCLSSVQASARLSQVSADAVQGYYKADSQAEQILARLRAGECPAEVTLQDGIYEYRVPISETRDLHVQIGETVDPKTGRAAYEVLTWKAENTAAWEADTMITLWGGE